VILFLHRSMHRAARRAAFGERYRDRSRTRYRSTGHFFVGVLWARLRQQVAQNAPLDLRNMMQHAL